MSDIETRLRALEDQNAILDRLYAYGHSLDYGDRDEWIDCWTTDAVLDWPHQTFTGHGEIGKAFDDHSHIPDAFHKHMLIEPRVKLSRDEAHVQSYFTRIDAGEHGPWVRSIGRYIDRVVRCDDGVWRIAHRVCDREGLVPGAPVT